MQLHENITHYMKWKIPNVSSDLTVRYFFSFDTGKKFEKQWVLKVHSKKEYTIIPETTARLLIESVSEVGEEIIGRKKANGIYEKIIIKEDQIITVHETDKGTQEELYIKKVSYDQSAIDICTSSPEEEEEFKKYES